MGNWTRPMEQESPRDSLKEKHWRKIERIIIHKGYQNDALIWSGNDLALLKLESRNGQDVPAGKIMPACLAIDGFEDKHNGSLFMAGYGRRRIPHCLTNDVGPEKYEVCGRQKECSKNFILFSVIFLVNFSIVYLISINIFPFCTNFI